MGKKSIVQQGDPRCFVCGRVTELECHHIMGGVANRPISDKYGLTIWLCREHHTGDSGVHKNRDLSDKIKRLGQIAFEAKYSHDDWMKLFGKNYLGVKIRFVYDDEDNEPM